MPRPKIKPGPCAKDLRNLKMIKAYMTEPTLKEAYMKVYPNASEATALCGGVQKLTPEIFESIKELMGISSCVKADKDMLEKVLFLVVSRWIDKHEKTADMIAAVRELTKLVPEFKDKLQVEDITKASEEEIDRKIRGLGYDPSIVSAN